MRGKKWLNFVFFTFVTEISINDVDIQIDIWMFVGSIDQEQSGFDGERRHHEIDLARKWGWGRMQDRRDDTCRMKAI